MEGRNSKDIPELERLAEEARDYALKLEEVNSEFMAEMEELGYETEM